MVLGGYTFHAAQFYLRMEKTCPEANRALLKKLLLSDPMRKRMDELFADLLTTTRVLGREYFPSLYGLAVTVGGRRIVPLAGAAPELTAKDWLTFLRERNGCWILPNEHRAKGRLYRISRQGEMLLLDGAEQTDAELLAFLNQLPDQTLLLEHIEPAGDACPEAELPVLHYALLRRECETEEILLQWEDHGNKKGYSPFSFSTVDRKPDRQDDRVRGVGNFAQEIARRYPEMPYVGVNAVLTEDGFTVLRVDTGTELAWVHPLTDSCRRAAQILCGGRKKNTLKDVFARIRAYTFAWRAHRRGFVDFMYRNWLRGVQEDNQTAHTTRAQKRWAHKRGFYSYRIAQYGLTEENYRSFLSDYQYKRLRPLNPGFQKWFWNKTNLPDILADYSEHLPRYFFRILVSNGRQRIFGYQGRGECSWQNVIDCLDRERELAMKPAVGSHGKGFFHLHREDDSVYRVNDRPCTRGELEDFFCGLDTDYIVTEYIRMHPYLEEIYSGVTGTVRLMVLCRQGQASIRYGYFRIGTSFTGATDNIAYGGLVVPLDVQTGTFSGAELLREHQFLPCPVHPDTGREIRGQMPHWQQLVDEICRISRNLSPLEYLGYDVVVTEGGFKILEVNLHQDLHRYPLYPADVKEYLTERAAQKDKRFGPG